MANVLIVGIKNRGASWARAVIEHPRFALAGLADVDRDVLAQRGDELGVPPEGRHTDVEGALASGRYDAAIVVVPNHLHYPVAGAVLRAGVACLLEKPFAEQMAHAEELVALADSRGLPLVIAQNYRYKPLYARAAATLRGGELGRLGALRSAFYRYRPPRYEHERRMAYPLLYLQAIHHLDWMLSILESPIRELHVHHSLPPWSEWRSPSVCTISARCEDGVLVSYAGSYECRGRQSPFAGIWRLECERGDLVMDAEHKLWRVDASGATLLHEAPADEVLEGDLGLLDALSDAMEKGIEAPTSGRNNLATMKLLFEVARPR
jgi:predicted dehydrogenase